MSTKPSQFNPNINYVVTFMKKNLKFVRILRTGEDITDFCLKIHNKIIPV